LGLSRDTNNLLIVVIVVAVLLLMIGALGFVVLFLGNSQRAANAGFLLVVVAVGSCLIATRVFLATVWHPLSHMP